MSSMLSWIWGSIYSKKSDPATPPTTGTAGVSRGIQAILDAEDALMKREAFLQKSIEKELQIAREANQKGNRALAMRHLKAKKQKTEELTNIAGQLANLSAMRIKMEEQQMNVTVFKAHQDAVDAFKSMELNADEVESQMDKARTAIDNLNEFSERLAQPLDPLHDEDELLSELMDFELDEQQLHSQPIIKTQPTAVRVAMAEDDLLLERQAQMLTA